MFLETSNLVQTHRDRGYIFICLPPETRTVGFLFAPCNTTDQLTLPELL